MPPLQRPSLLPHPSRRSAFTLIEILICVTIMAIAAAVVVPQMNDRSDAKVSSATRALVADLLYAQSNSIAHCCWTYVAFDVAHNKYSLLSALPATTLTHPVYYQPYIVAYGPNTPCPDVTLGAVALNSDTTLTTLAFDSLGTPYAVDATNNPVLLAASAIPVTCKTLTMTVIVEPITGQIRIQ